MEKTDSLGESQQVSDPELVDVLEEMLAVNETITARAVARKHPSVRHASSITRHPVRSELLRQYQVRQEQFRRWADKLPKISRSSVAARLAEKDQRIADLERQVEILRASHVAMIRLAGELGGMRKWLQFFESSRDALAELKRIAALPERSAQGPIPMRNRQHGKPE
jgi:hypothetical protein